jgi:GNAT superfamily N-acetyltransferase
MIIREALEAEMNFIRKQRLQSYEEHAQKIPLGHWLALKESILANTDSQQGVERMVAELQGELVGSVILFPAKVDPYGGAVGVLKYPEIRMLAVAPNARGKGVAKALIQECIVRTKEKGFSAIGLHTADFMEDAVQLYVGLGFKRVPKHDFFPLEDGILVKAYRLTF